MSAALLGHGAEAVGAVCVASSVCGALLLPFIPFERVALMQAPMFAAMVSTLLCIRFQIQAKKKSKGWSGDFNALSPMQQNVIWFLARLQTWPTVQIWMTPALVGLRDYYTYVPLPKQSGQEQTLAIGGMPLPWQIRSMHARGIRGVVNACEEFGGYSNLYHELGVEQCRCPTVDYCNVDAKNIEKGVAFIHRKIQAGESVYVHCKSGIGRCAQILVSYIARHHNMSVEEANAFVKSKRKVIIGNVAERPAVREYFGLPP